VQRRKKNEQKVRDRTSQKSLPQKETQKKKKIGKGPLGFGGSKSSTELGKVGTSHIMGKVTQVKSPSWLRAK